MQGFSARKAAAGETVGRRDCHQQGQKNGHSCQKNGIPEPEGDVLPKEDFPVVFQSEISGNKRKIGAEQTVRPVKGDAQSIENGNQCQEAQRNEKDI